MKVVGQRPPRRGRRNPARENRVEWVNVGPRPAYTRRTILLIVLVSLLFHAGLFFVLPEHFLTVPPSKWGKPGGRQIMLHMVQPKPKEPEPRQDQYVQATDAPENKPDKTTNFSSKDQQAAQKMESKDKTGKTPEVENGESPDSNALQTGTAMQQATMEELVRQSNNYTQNEKPSDARQAQQGQNAQKEPQQGEDQQKQEGPQQAQPQEAAAPPLPDAIAEQKPEDDGKGYAEVLKRGREEEMPEKPPEDRVIPAVATNPYVTMEVPKVDQSDTSGMKPRPRPRLAIPAATPSVLRKTSSGFMTSAGVVAWDSKMSAYGDYLARMFEVITRKWYDLNESTPVNVADSSTYVQLEFTLTKEGQIENLKVLETNSSQSAQWRCLDAVQANAPYFEWTDDMITVLGDSQVVRVQFYYR